MPYHHGNLRAALVEAAVELAAKDGPDAVVLREVARHVGVSHNAAYRHVANRDELLHAVAARAHSRFGELMRARIAEAAPGRRGKQASYDRFEACGRAYVEFATEHTGLFRTLLAFPMGNVAPDDDSVPQPYDQLAERLDELVTVKAITSQRRANAEVAAMSAVHGFAMFVIDGPWGDVPADQRERDLAEVLRVVRTGV